MLGGCSMAGGDLLSMNSRCQQIQILQASNINSSINFGVDIACTLLLPSIMLLGGYVNLAM